MRFDWLMTTAKRRAIDALRRGDLLEKLGCFEEARTEFERAAELTRNARERKLLLERAAPCADTAGSVSPPPPIRAIVPRVNTS